MDVFKNALLSALNKDAELYDCNRGSLLLAAARAAADGLMPDGHEAAIVRYKDKAQYLPMVAGVIKRMYQSGGVSAVQAFVVYKNDEFEILGGTEPALRHKPTLGPRGELVCAYATATTPNGGSTFEFLHSEDIAKIRRASRSSAKGPWVDWTEQMWKKSALHRLAKRLPQSREIVQMLDRDAGYDRVTQTVPAVGPLPQVQAPEVAFPAESDEPDYDGCSDPVEGVVE